MKTGTPEPKNDLHPEYDFDFCERRTGSLYKRLLKEGSNNVVLEPDVAKAFPNSHAVNDARRAVIEFCPFIKWANPAFDRYAGKSAARG